MSCLRRLATSVVALLIGVGALHAEPWSPRPFLKDEDVKTILRHEVAILSRYENADNANDPRALGTAYISGQVIALTALDYAGPQPRGRMEALFEVGSQLMWSGRIQAAIKALKNYPKLDVQRKSQMDFRTLLKRFPEHRELMGVFARRTGGPNMEQTLEMLVKRPLPWSRASLKDDRVRNMALVTALIARLTAQAKNTDRWLPGEDWLVWSKQMREASVDLAAALKKREPEKARQAARSLHTSCVHCHDRETVAISRLKMPALLQRAQDPSTKRRDLFLHAVALRTNQGSVRGRQQAVDVVLGALDDRHAPVRRQATEELSRFKMDAGRIVPRLVEELRDTDRQVRGSAGWTLRMLGVNGKAVTDAMGTGELPDSEDYARLWMAYHTNGKNDDPDKTLAILVQRFAKADATTRALTVECLATLPGAGQKATTTFERALVESRKRSLHNGWGFRS